MKFCEYQDEYSAFRRYRKSIGNHEELPTFGKFYESILRGMDMKSDSSGAMIAEYFWWKAGRPYYNLWPSVYKGFSEFKVGKVPPSMYIGNSDPYIVIQFPGDGFCGARSLLVSAVKRGSFTEAGGGIETPKCHFLQISVELNKVVEMNIGGPRYEIVILSTIIPDERIDVAAAVEAQVEFVPLVNIAIAVLLLERDPSIIEPDILKADMGRYDNADFDAKKRLEERSFNRRGQRGYHIGRKFESIPHYRVPHPALVWTEKGRTVPKVIMRAGSVVHRQKMTDAPTGYHGPLVEDANVTASNDT